MKTNKRIIYVLIVISAMFLALLSYLLYFNMFQADKIAANPYNRRQWDDEKYVTRGTIYDADALVLAESVSRDGGENERVYSQGRLYSHIIGYYSQLYGKSLLESEFDSYLLGKGDLSIFQGDKRRGFDLRGRIGYLCGGRFGDRQRMGQAVRGRPGRSAGTMPCNRGDGRNRGSPQ